jgi:YD repeat-containing protein
MKRFVLGFAAAVALSSAAFADVMANRYGNTVVITDSKGAVTKLMYDQDGKMSIAMPDGTKGTGKWALKDGKLCITADAGPTAGKEQCNAVVDHKVGDEWDVPLADGTKGKAKLVAGR